MKRVLCGLGFAFLIVISFLIVFGPKETLAQVGPAKDKCGTMSLLDIAIKKDPGTTARLVAQEAQLQQRLAAHKLQVEGSSAGGTLLIPGVFHIVLIDTSPVTDAQIPEQVEIFDKDYAGFYSDSVKITSWVTALVRQFS